MYLSQFHPLPTHITYLSKIHINVFFTSQPEVVVEWLLLRMYKVPGSILGPVAG